MKQFWMMRFWAGLAMALMAAMPLRAQDCAELRQQAQRLYDRGDIDGAYAKLQECLGSEKAFARAERGVKADLLWIATQIYLLRKQNEEARAAFRSMLAYRPYFKPSAQDLQDIGLMHASFAVTPRLAIGLTGTSGVSMAHVLRSMEILEGNDESERSPKSYQRFMLSWGLGMSVSWSFHKNWQLRTGIRQLSVPFRYRYGLSQSEVRYDIDFRENDQGVFFFDTLSKETYSLQYEYEHRQRMTYLVVPLLLRGERELSDRAWLYAEAGVYMGYLSVANRFIAFSEADSYVRESAKDGNVDSHVERLSDVFTTDATALFTKGNMGWQVGVGGKFRMRGGLRCSVGLQYMRGFFNLTKQSARYTYEDLTYSFYDLPDDLTLSALSVQVGVEVPLLHHAFDRQRKPKSTQKP